MSTLRILSLGGCGGFGMNATLLAWEDRPPVLIDFGVGFPNEEGLGIDRQVPDPTPLLDEFPKLQAILLTHAHDDHIAALGRLPEAWREAKTYGSPFTIAAAKDRVADDNVRMRFEEVDTQERVTIDEEWLKVTFFPVTHSVPQSRILLLDTPMGRFVHSGDFKLDRTPTLDPENDLAALYESCRQHPVRLLMCDSTGATRPGWSASESDLVGPVEELIKAADQQVFVTTFSSQIARVQTMIDIAKRQDRRVCLLGRRMNRMWHQSLDMGLVRAPAGWILNVSEIENFPRQNRLYMCAGCQGEFESALSRLSFGTDSRAEIVPGDLVLFSSTVIPGNEVLISLMVDRLLRRGAEVKRPAAGGPTLHASGHGASDEIRALIDTVKPAGVLPIHGDREHLMACADIAASHGADTIVVERGEWLNVDANRMVRGDSIELYPLSLDSDGRSIGVEQLRERRRMARGGALFVSLGDAVATTDSSHIEIYAQGLPEWSDERAEALREMIFSLITDDLRVPMNELRSMIEYKISQQMRGRQRRNKPVVVVSGKVH